MSHLVCVSIYEVDIFLIRTKKVPALFFKFFDGLSFSTASEKVLWSQYGSKLIRKIVDILHYAASI